MKKTFLTILLSAAMAMGATAQDSKAFKNAMADAMAGNVDAELVDSLYVALICCLLIPAGSLFQVFSHSYAFNIADGKLVLGVNVTLGGRLAEPACSLLVVLLHSDSLEI